MPDAGDARQVEVQRIGALDKFIGGSADIPKRAGISAARFINAAILDVPDSPPALAQALGHPVHQRAVCNRFLPAPAMHHDDDRMRPFALRHPKVHDVRRQIAPEDFHGRLRPGAAGKVRPGHQGWRRVGHPRLHMHSLRLAGGED